MAAITVFGAGAAGTAIAIHLSRAGRDVVLWGSEFDAAVLAKLEADRAHPALRERVPDAVRVLGPDALGPAADHGELAVLGANSRGARSLARLVAPAVRDDAVLVSITKGLENDTMRRMSEVYGEELAPRPVVSVGGPMLAPELAEGSLTAVVFASADRDALRTAAAAFRSESYLVEITEDVVGVELCGTAKNVAAIGAGVLEGLAQGRQRELKNARAALLAQAAREIAELVEALGGRRATALGLAGLGDLLVTAMGGRNRLYGEAIGLGGSPDRVLEDMQARGLTVEGAESADEVVELAGQAGLALPLHRAVHDVIHDRARPDTILEAIR